VGAAPPDSKPKAPPTRIVRQVLRVILAIIGALAVLTGVVFIGQGINVIHGSSMSGHGGYAGLGAVLLVIGVGLILWAWRLRRPRGA
jgi:protein-S-isoprenylcysteine O-methyltransferase Ste14